MVKNLCSRCSYIEVYHSKTRQGFFCVVKFWALASILAQADMNFCAPFISWRQSELIEVAQMGKTIRVLGIAPIFKPIRRFSFKRASCEMNLKQENDEGIKIFIQKYFFVEFTERQTI